MYMYLQIKKNIYKQKLTKYSVLYKNIKKVTWIQKKC